MQPARQASLTGWRPTSEASARVFKDKRLRFRHCSLSELQEGIKESVMEVSFDTASSRRRKLLQSKSGLVNEAKKLVARAPLLDSGGQARSSFCSKKC